MVGWKNVALTIVALMLYLEMKMGEMLGLGWNYFR